MTKQKDWSGFTAQQIKWLDSKQVVPNLFEDIQKDMQHYIDKNLRLLIYKDDNTSNQNAVVVTLTRAYPRFASGYTYNKLDGTKTPYTVNYSALVDKFNRTRFKVEKK